LEHREKRKAEKKSTKGKRSLVDQSRANQKKKTPGFGGGVGGFKKIFWSRLTKKKKGKRKREIRTKKSMGRESQSMRQTRKGGGSGGSLQNSFRTEQRRTATPRGSTAENQDGGKKNPCAWKRWWVLGKGRNRKNNEGKAGPKTKAHAQGKDEKT